MTGRIVQCIQIKNFIRGGYMAKEKPFMTDVTGLYPEGYAFNLSDFALFLSVMKNKKAYECVLSIILDEPDIKMEEVKVEQVILNRYGKRAIRLDAWGKTVDDRRVNMEMENHSGNDSVAKRSRYYQGLLDSPLLKSGKKTKYKELPSTIIIFITQEDIFGRDRAKYTFTEQCEEIKGLHLEDGTTQIFLNMTSKNGSKELISLLQYMKNTKMDNPEIKVKDERIVELDKIVSEVKESEEWEAVQMNILEIGISQGESQKLVSQVCKKLGKGCSVAEIADMLEEETEVIQNICNVAEQYAPDYDVEKISRALISYH